MNLKRKSSLSIHDARIAGLYDLEHTIGRGHFAVVKLARHVFTGEKVAVKVIDKTKLDKQSAAHIMQEVRCMKLVQHPNVVRLYEVIDTQTKMFLILELADYDMYDYIIRHTEKGCSETEAQRYFSQIIKAIDYCHALHVVHRDLKPENVVFFEKLETVKLTDFGFSNLFTPGKQLETCCGSLAYSAPEILLGDAYDAPAIDIWSCGVILFMLVVGRLPFQESNDSETLTKILDCRFSLPDTLSEECKLLIKRMLVREPEKRASLAEIVNSSWVRAGDSVNVVTEQPLITRWHLPDTTNATIIDQMVLGGIASKEDILRAIDNDDYSYVTATYFLLAERLLREEQIRRAAADTAIIHIDESSTLDRQGCDASSLTKQLPTSGASAPILNSATNSTAIVGRSRSRSNSWRGHPCTILKEESEEELSSYLRMSRHSSRNSSPSTSMLATSSSGYRNRVSPQDIQDLLELKRLHTSRRRSPDSRRSSRSPSPVSSARSSSPVSSIVGGRSKSTACSSTLRRLGSSPHLLGICEESEDQMDSPHASNSDFINHKKAPPSTYSSVRMIRQRQAVVSPDMIRRYEHHRVNSAPRPRRSTSCSSSEASDEDGERKLSVGGICKHCRRWGNDDDDGGASGGGGGPSIGGGNSASSNRYCIRHSHINTTSSAVAKESNHQQQKQQSATNCTIDDNDNQHRAMFIDDRRRYLLARRFHSFDEDATAVAAVNSLSSSIHRPLSMTIRVPIISV